MASQAASSHSETEKCGHEFEQQGASKHTKSLQKAKDNEGVFGVNLQTLFTGIAVLDREDGGFNIGFASHDGTYSIDFATFVMKGNQKNEAATNGQTRLPFHEHATIDADWFVEKIRNYTQKNMYKFVGAGLTKRVFDLSPQLPSRLWSDLDIVPFVFGGEEGRVKNTRTCDELADTVARRCVIHFGPSRQPILQVGYHNEVEVDVGNRAKITALYQYPSTVSEATWKATMKYVESLNEKKTKIAFFNSTPQGGGVALMRHALMRFFRLADVDAHWYVPKPKPEVFRITKTNHNILQAVARPDERLTQKQIETLEEWAEMNAQRYWTVENGPLAPPSKGGADFIIVDDPQLPSLVRIAKEQDPKRPVMFRSHIQVRSDLADKQGTPTSEVWNWIWDHVKGADLFISHPVRSFVPSSVPISKVAWLPATTDWLDGLNKDLAPYDQRFYYQELETECFKTHMTQLAFPKRQYIAQVARFDPSKGIPDVLAAYAELRRKYMADYNREDTPQLLLAGHGAIDDPDGTRIFDETLDALGHEYSDLKNDVVVMRLGPTDQYLNVLISNAKVALQLSTREGFEVKVSEALHKGIPVIASLAGGIPLQVEHEKSGFLVKESDSSAVAKHLFDLFSDDVLYNRMSEYARLHVSDEVSTVGNALSWLFLADKMAARKEGLQVGGRWINDLAREEAGYPYKEGESRLPRPESLDVTSKGAVDGRNF